MTAMMRLDTNPMTPGLRAGRAQADGMSVLIQVPRVDEPRGRVRVLAAGGGGRRPCRRAGPFAVDVGPDLRVGGVRGGGSGAGSDWRAGR